MYKTLRIENANIVRHPGGGYGQYQVIGEVNGEVVKAHTTNSEAFDYFNDDSNQEKHLEAIDFVESLLIRTYEEN